MKNGKKIIRKIENLYFNLKYKMDTILFYSPKDRYFEFSNYYMLPVKVGNITYPSTESAFQAAKFYYPDNKDMMDYFYLIVNSESSQRYKSLGSQKPYFHGNNWLINKSKPELGYMNDVISKYKDIVKPIENWDEIKDQIMEIAVFAKFKQNKKLKDLLLSTGNAELVENSPRDYYWGIGKDGKGKNMLGKILMKVRELLKSDKIPGIVAKFDRKDNKTYITLNYKYE